jgi:hypothetical protein
MPDDDNVKWMPIKDIHREEGARELTESPEMEPYLNFAVALMRGHDPEPELDELRQLPLEERHIWRVVSALKWGFADFDDLSVSADRDTTPPEDLAKAFDLLPPIQQGRNAADEGKKRERSKVDKPTHWRRLNSTGVPVFVTSHKQNRCYWNTTCVPNQSQGPKKM